MADYQGQLIFGLLIATVAFEKDLEHLLTILKILWTAPVREESK